MKTSLPKVQTRGRVKACAPR